MSGVPNPIAGNSPEERIAKLERAVSALERHKSDFHTFSGPRTDLPSGWGLRLRIGKLSDGSYAVERYTISGTRQTPTWS
jgi:hypothetical protein